MTLEKSTNIFKTINGCLGLVKRARPLIEDISRLIHTQYIRISDDL